MADKSFATSSSDQPCENTDRELYRAPPGDYYANSIHVTKEGGIGFNVGGFVIVLPLKTWHALASGASVRSETAATSEGYPGIAHDLETMRAALIDLNQASLRMAQLVNMSRGEGASVADWDTARQALDVARKQARAALKNAAPQEAPQVPGRTREETPGVEGAPAAPNAALAGDVTGPRGGVSPAVAAPSGELRIDPRRPESIMSEGEERLPGLVKAVASAVECKPQSSYVPLTEQEIEHVRSVYKRYFSDSARLDVVCDMAINCLLYAEEIHRLRDGTPSSARVTTPESPALTLARTIVAIDDEAGPVPDRLDKWSVTTALARALVISSESSVRPAEGVTPDEAEMLVNALEGIAMHEDWKPTMEKLKAIALRRYAPSATRCTRYPGCGCFGLDVCADSSTIADRK